MSCYSRHLTTHFTQIIHSIFIVFDLQMTNILALVTVLFLALIVYLITKIQLDRKKFQSRIKVLEDFIVQISNEQQTQSNQLQLSDELKEKLTLINATLSKDIYEMNFKLVEELYPRK